MFRNNTLSPESADAGATCPTCSDFAVFFLEPGQGQVTVCQRGQEYVPMPSKPSSSFIMIKAKLFFELRQARFSPGSYMIEPGQIKRRHGLRHSAEKVPQRHFSFGQMPSLDQKPDSLANNTVSPTVGRVNPE